jgi:GTP-binding protein
VNVGKSALFNRLARRKIAVVDDLAGVTRDRVYAETDLDGRRIVLVDTGGLAGGREDDFYTKVRDQALAALGEADLLIFVVDAQTGLMPMDEDVAAVVRRTGKPVVFVANKAESRKAELAEFTRMGFGEPVPVSAIHAHGIDELVEELLARLPEAEEAAEEEEGGVAVAIVGRPNAGKSSIVNALIGEDRMIVSDMPGTTRDAVDTAIERDDKRFVLVDTAGLRRKFKKAEGVEYYGAIRALRAIERADVAVLVMDAHEGVTTQDARLVGEVEEMGRGLVLCAHKWDLVMKAATEGSTSRAESAKQERLLHADYERMVRHALPFVEHAPLLFTSTVTGLGIEKVLAAAAKVAEGVNRHVGTGEVNRAVRRAVSEHAPPSPGGRQLKIYYATQVMAKPPTIVCFVNDRELLVDSYKRYLEKQLRGELFGPGVPLRLFFRPRPREERRGSSSRKSGRER